LDTAAGPFSTGFSHVVVNVRDLERSVMFYETTTPLRRVVTTPTPMQPFATLGIARGQFRGVLLRDPAVPLAPAVHLVQWIAPVPAGRPYAGFTNPGFFRLCFKYNNAAHMYDRVIAAGSTPFTEPLMGEGKKRPGRPVFSTPDPDGVVIQYLSLPGMERLFHVCCNCSDLARAATFYEMLGLHCYMRLGTTEPERFSFGPPGGPATFDAALFEHPDDESPDDSPSFSIDVVRWKIPEPVGTAYGSQTNLGIVRIGLVARDLDSASANLDAHGYPVSAVEVRDFGGAVGIRRAAVVRNPDGALIELLDNRI
jgi:catechol 2,3-dioxygenase-like lactoylglutathione lyase family enzyme